MQGSTFTCWITYLHVKRVESEVVFFVCDWITRKAVACSRVGCTAVTHKKQLSSCRVTTPTQELSRKNFKNILEAFKTPKGDIET